MKTFIDVLKFVMAIFPQIIGLMSDIDKRKDEKRKKQEEDKGKDIQ